MGPEVHQLPTTASARTPSSLPALLRPLGATLHRSYAVGAPWPEGILLCGDTRELGLFDSCDGGVIGGDILLSEGTTVVPAPITTTSSFDIARLTKYK